MLHQDMRYYVDRERDILYQVLEKFKDNVEVLQKSNFDFDSIVIFATGSSANAAYAAKPFLCHILNVNVEIKEPSMALNYERSYNSHTMYLAISQGGHSTSTLKMITSLQDTHVVYAITSDPESPIAKESKNVLLLGMQEDMPFVTAGVASTILFLWLIGLEVAVHKHKMSLSSRQEYIDEIKQVIDTIPYVIEKTDHWFDRKKDILFAGNRFLAIGYGSCYGSAREFETKFTETVRVPSAGFELEEFMHGPYIGIQETDIVFVLDPNGILSERTRKLTSFLRDHIQEVYYFSNSDEKADICLEATSSEYFSCILYNIIIHICSWNISQHKKIDLTQSSYPDFDEKMKSKI